MLEFQLQIVHCLDWIQTQNHTITHTHIVTIDWHFWYIPKSNYSNLVRSAFRILMQRNLSSQTCVHCDQHVAADDLVGWTRNYNPNLEAWESWHKRCVHCRQRLWHVSLQYDSLRYMYCCSHHFSCGCVLFFFVALL